MRQDRHTYLTTAPVARVISTLAIPTIISMLTTSFYNMADTFFVGRIDTQATAAVGVVLPVMSIIQAIGFFFGHGSGNFISRQLGARHVSVASTMAATGFIYSVGFGLAVAILGLCFLQPISQVLGSTPTVLPYTMQYLGIVFMGAPFICGQLTLNNQMRLQGNAAYGMVGIVSGAVINILLDPLFIFTFDMGVGGAALATVCAQVTAFCIQLFMTTRGGNLRINLRLFDPSLTFVKEIISGGAPSLTRQTLVCIAVILLNWSAGQYGGDAGIAGMSIVSRISFFVNAILIGYGQGFQPLCGFSYGAGLYSRVKEGYWFCVRFSIVFLLIVGSFGYIYADQVIALFRDDPDVIAVGAATFRWQILTYPLGCIVMYSNMLMQTIRKPIRASILSAARQGIFFIPALLLLSHLYGMFGVIITQAVADVCSFALCIPFMWSIFRELSAQEAQMK